MGRLAGANPKDDASVGLLTGPGLVRSHGASRRAVARPSWLRLVDDLIGENEASHIASR